jgi:hypothetical protein
VFIVLYRERLVSTLIKMTAAYAISMQMPASNMGRSEPLYEMPKIAVPHRPQDHVPVIRHNTIGQNSNRYPLCRLANDMLEGFVIWFFLKNPRSRPAPLSRTVTASSVPRCFKRPTHDLLRQIGGVFRT